jgi:hypothetical protein
MLTITIAAQLVTLAIPLTEDIIAAVNAEMSLSGSGDGPTAGERATIDAGLAAAHAALQSAQQGSY